MEPLSAIAPYDEPVDPQEQVGRLWRLLELREPSLVEGLDPQRPGVLVCLQRRRIVTEKPLSRDVLATLDALAFYLAQTSSIAAETENDRPLRERAEALKQQRAVCREKVHAALLGIAAGA